MLKIDTVQVFDLKLMINNVSLHLIYRMNTCNCVANNQSRDQTVITVLTVKTLLRLFEGGPYREGDYFNNHIPGYIFI